MQRHPQSETRMQLCSYAMKERGRRARQREALLSKSPATRIPRTGLVLLGGNVPHVAKNLADGVAPRQFPP